MNARVRAICTAGLLAVAASSVAAELPQAGTQESVRYRFGIPNAIRFDATGAQVWEYSDWRNGQSFVVRFDAAGSVSGSRPLRTGQDVERAVAERLTAREALDQLGEPHSITAQPQGFTWTYRQASGPRLAVSFGPDGRITGVANAR